jgi:hypothetical protein
MSTMITQHLRLGDVAVLLLLALALFSVFYGLGMLATRPRRSPLGRLGKRAAAGTIVRSIGGRFSRMGWQSWN